MSEDKLAPGKLIGFMREKKSLWLIIAALILGVVLILYGSTGTADSKSRAVSAGLSGESSSEFEVKLESRLKTLCEQVGGVSNVSVMITLESFAEQVYAQNLESSESETSRERRSEYIQVGGDTLVPTKELSPCVRGVAIVCTGGDDAGIQLKLTKLVSSLFGIPSSSISVVGGK